MKIFQKLSEFKKDYTVGYFLAIRELKRSNPWSTALVIFVMSLTFMNMVLMGGVLIGLAEGMMNSFQKYYSSDVLIKPAVQNYAIMESSLLQNVIKTLPTYKASSSRYTASVVIENGDKIKVKETDIRERVSGTLVGINPKDENSVTGISTKIIEGSYLDDYSTDKIVIGKSLLAQYSNGSSTEPRLKDIKVGSRLLLLIGESKMEVTVQGIIDSGNSTVDGRIFISETTMRALTRNQSLNESEIAISLTIQCVRTGCQGIYFRKFSV